MAGPTRREGQVEAALAQPRLQVIGVERGELGDPVHALAAQHSGVDVGAQQHAGIAHEGAEAADALRQILLVQPAVFFTLLADQRDRHERQQALGHAHRAGTRTTAAVRRAEGLVQIHVDHVEAHIARAHLAKDGVEVGAVVIQQATDLVHDLGDLGDLALEYAQGGRVGQHDAGGLRPDSGLERLDIDVALGIGGNLAHGHAEHGGGGRVGAVRRIRHQDLGTGQIVARAVVGADHRHTGELALGAGHRRQ